MHLHFAGLIPRLQAIEKDNGSLVHTVYVVRSPYAGLKLIQSSSAQNLGIHAYLLGVYTTHRILHYY